MDPNEKVRTQNRSSADAWHAIADAVAPADAGIAERARQIAASLDLPLPAPVVSPLITSVCDRCALVLTGPADDVFVAYASHQALNPVLGMSQCDERREIVLERRARQAREADTLTMLASRAMGVVA